MNGESQRLKYSSNFVRVIPHNNEPLGKTIRDFLNYNFIMSTY